MMETLRLNNNSIFEVQDGGVFNFNFDDADNPLLITNGALGTNKFESKQNFSFCISFLLIFVVH